jgi:hypothetical protein
MNRPTVTLLLVAALLLSNLLWAARYRALDAAYAQEEGLRDEADALLRVAQASRHGADSDDVSSVFETSKAPDKFYITGLAHTATANDCTIPPIVAYGSSRVNALLHCCEGGALTVWTEAEYKEMRQRIGKEFDESCEALPTPAPNR